ncbi:hypothetical protein H4R35_002245 [Dimargaris xerosporica]|nr:hypothetical protein H4R35_002245 [Dimargaris xerosporica]
MSGGLKQYHHLDPNIKSPIALRYPWVHRYCLLIAGVIILILLVVVGLLLFLSLSKNGQPCGPACLGVGESGLYLRGFGQASVLWSTNDTCRSHADEDVYYAAMNVEQYGTYRDWSQSPVCQKCIRVYGPAGNIQAKIVDRCQNCTYGSVALSRSAYSIVADKENGQVPVRWEGC